MWATINLPHLTYGREKGHGVLLACLQTRMQSPVLSPAAHRDLYLLQHLPLSLDSQDFFYSVWSSFPCAVNVHSSVSLASLKLFTEITQLLLSFFFSYSSSLYVYTFKIPYFHFSGVSQEKKNRLIYIVYLSESNKNVYPLLLGNNLIL